MPTHLATRRGIYADSVSLMQVSQAVTSVNGVESALVAMGTPVNLELLPDMGFEADDLDAGPTDLVVAIRARDDEALQAGIGAVETGLAGTGARGGGRGGGFGEAPPARTTIDAVTSDTTLVLVSTPGGHAVQEARDAIAAGVDVMVFSDNVAVEDEVALKEAAGEAGVLVMGPDAGTAIISGVGLGFANVVAPGPVGIVAASGTGAQQLTCLLDDAGIGVSHVLGVGGRDLSARVGGRSTRAGLALLDDDPATEVIVVLSKPPDPEVAAAIRTAADEADTPVVMGLLGPGRDDLTTIARAIADHLGVVAETPASWEVEQPRSERPGRLVGLFAGGTLATEAALVAAEVLDGPVTANVASPVTTAARADAVVDGHLVLDLGADEFTTGRPHPMIDQSLRLERIATEAPRTTVLLLDVVLGHGAHPDPASELVPVLRRAREATPDLAVVVSLCASTGDPQGRDSQAAALHEAGASVHLSNSRAARAACELATGGSR